MFTTIVAFARVDCIPTKRLQSPPRGLQVALNAKNAPLAKNARLTIRRQAFKARNRANEAKAAQMQRSAKQKIDSTFSRYILPVTRRAAAER